MNSSLETFLDVANMPTPQSFIITDGVGAKNGTEVDLQDTDGCAWVVVVTNVNTTGTLQLLLQHNAVSATAEATATDRDGNNMDTGAAAITAVGTYIVTAKSESLLRFSRLVATVATVGIDFIMYPIPHGHQYKSKPTESIAVGDNLVIQLAT